MSVLPEGFPSKSRQSYHAPKDELSLPWTIRSCFRREGRKLAFCLLMRLAQSHNWECSPFSPLGTPRGPGMSSSSSCALMESSASWTCAAFPSRGTTRSSIARRSPRSCAAPGSATCTCAVWADCGTRGEIRRIWAGAMPRFEDSPIICRRRNSRRDCRD